ncbi:MAG: hypothetical protein V4513_09060 [Pseudomonadota bacterium]
MDGFLQDAWGVLTGAMSSWHQGKLLVEHALTISHDTLHVLVGVILWLLIALLVRRPITSWRPWLWLLAIICWNETVDLWNETWPDPGEQFGEGLKDLALTVFLPALIMAAARLRPDLFRQGASRARDRRKRRK